MIEAAKWSKIIPHELASTTANRAYLAFNQKYFNVIRFQRKPFRLRRKTKKVMYRT